MKEKADFKRFSKDLPSGLFLITFGRFISNVAYRLVFPFLPTISRGLGVTTGTLGTALAMRDLVEMSSPLLGKVIDKRGTKYQNVFAQEKRKVESEPGASPLTPTCRAR